MPSQRKKTKKKLTKTTTQRAKKTLRKKPSKPPKKAIKRKQTKKTPSSKASPAGRVRRGQRLESSRGTGVAVSTRQSGEFQGLSREEQANSESVDELVEEGNIFEAGAVAGVEEADNHDTREVHTNEVPEDDVPEEYLEKD